MERLNAGEGFWPQLGMLIKGLPMGLLTVIQMYAVLDSRACLRWHLSCCRIKRETYSCAQMQLHPVKTGCLSPTEVCGIEMAPGVCMIEPGLLATVIFLF